MQVSVYTFTSTDAVAFSNAHFGAGIGSIHLHVVGCTGRETNLTDCPQVRSSVYCLQGHSEDAGVRCQGYCCMTLIHIIALKQTLKGKMVLLFYSYSWWQLYLW